MKVAALKNTLRYGGMSPLRLKMRVISSLGNDRYNELLDVDYMECANGKVIFNCRRDTEPPKRCKEILDALERYGYPDDAEVELRASAKLLERRLLTRPQEMVYEIPALKLRLELLDAILVAETRENY